MKPIKSPDELIKAFALDVTEVSSGSRYKELHGRKLEIELSLPFKSQVFRFPGNKYPSDLKFFRCEFLNPVQIRGFEHNLIFEECIFHSELDISYANLKGKVRFRNCHFKEHTNFNNTTFRDLADFWRSEFDKKVIFFKTDFYGTTVFSASRFNENVLFTYSLIDKLILFRGAIISKGLDLSTSILSGHLGIFDFSLNDFNSLDQHLNESKYEKAISKDGEIPIHNKRETFRILKKHHEGQSNIVASLPFKVLEKRTLLKESWVKLMRGESIFSNLSNLFVLLLNRVSNFFGIAFFQGLVFTILVGILFFYLSLINTGKYQFAWNIDWLIIKENISSFAGFLLPTHKFEYLGNDFTNQYELNNFFYLFDILGRILVGYGIYQTVQAFRRFR